MAANPPPRREAAPAVSFRAGQLSKAGEMVAAATAAYEKGTYDT